MKSIFKKQIAVILTITIVLSMMISGTVASAASVGSAGGGGSLVSAVGAGYNFLDVGSIDVIRNAHNKAKNVTSSNVSESSIADLLTDELIAKFDNNRSKAVSSVLSLLGKTLAVYYSTDVDNFASNLSSATTEIGPILDKIGVDTGVWFDLFFRTRLDATQAQYKTLWATGSMSAVSNNLDEVQIQAMKTRLNSIEYAETKAALSAVNWNQHIIVKGIRTVATYADQGRTAEYELIKAAARFGTEVYVDDVLYSEFREEHYLGKYWEDNVIKVTPVTEDRVITSYLEIIGEKGATNFAGYKSSNPDLVTIEADEVNSEFIITIKANQRGTADLVVMKDDIYGSNNGSLKDWIARAKLVVAYDMAKADAPVWTDNVLSWNAVPNATNYKVVIYKDDVVVKTIDVNETEFDATEVLSTYGNGEYKATVAAYDSAVPSIVGEVSEKSSGKVYELGLDTPAAPVWTQAGALTWVRVDDATNYVVDFYTSPGATTPAFTVELGDVDNIPASQITEYFKNYIGYTMYATVTAKNSTLSSDKSLKSTGIYVEVSSNKFIISGTVKLQGFSPVPALSESVFRSDNSGITVYINELKDKMTPVVTGPDGTFVLTDIPEKNDGTVYTIVFECSERNYLKRFVKLNKLVANKTLDTFLYFGDIKNVPSFTINHFDISQVVAYFGTTITADTPADIAALDVNDDNLIHNEEMVVLLRNANRTTTNTTITITD